MRDKILVIEGYGVIGTVISTRLSVLLRDKIVIGGRNLEKSMKLANQLDNVDMMFIGTNNFAEIHLRAIKIVVLTYDEGSTRFAEHCFTNGMSYINLTPSLRLILCVKELNELAVKNLSIWWIDRSIVLAIGAYLDRN